MPDPTTQDCCSKLGETISILTAELELSQKKCQDLENKLLRMQKLFNKATQYTEELKTQLTELKSEIYILKQESSTNVPTFDVEIQTYPDSYPEEEILEESGVTLEVTPESTPSHPEEDNLEPADLVHSAWETTGNTQNDGPEEGEIIQEEPLSVADSIREAAEAVQKQQGFIFDEGTGLYYDKTSGYYYDAEKSLYYEPYSGTYYYFNPETSEYEFHSQVDFSTYSDEAYARYYKNVTGKKVKKKKKKKDEKQEVETQPEANNMETTDIQKLQHSEGEDKKCEMREESSDSKERDKVKRDSKHKRKMIDTENDDNSIKEQKHKKKRKNKKKHDSDSDLSESHELKRHKHKHKRKYSDSDHENKDLRRKKHKKHHKKHSKKRKHDKKKSRKSNGSSSESDEEKSLSLHKHEVNNHTLREELYTCDSDSDSSSESSTHELEDLSGLSYPPSIRMMVIQSEHLDLGSLYIIPYTGGTIGRDTTLTHTLVIDDPLVSKMHCSVQYNEVGGCYELIDHATQNGTYINGNRLSLSHEISTPCAMKHKDQLQLGGTILALHIHPGRFTCDDCEPGQVQAKLPPQEPTGPIEVEADKETRRRKEIKQIRRRYGLEAAPYIEESVPNNPAYQDRSTERRRTKGSDNPYQKDDAPASVHKAITSENKGHKLLAKMGWKEGDSLGKSQLGIIQPIQAEIRANQAAGLGSIHGHAHSLDNVAKVKVTERWTKAQARYNKLTNQQEPNLDKGESSPTSHTSQKKPFIQDQTVNVKNAAKESSISMEIEAAPDSSKMTINWSKDHSSKLHISKNAPKLDTVFGVESDSDENS